MSDFLKMLEASGPFSAPLCLAMAYALRWVLKQNADLKLELKTAQGDATKLRDQRAKDLESMAREVGEIGEATRNTMREWTGRLRDTLAELARRGG